MFARIFRSLNSTYQQRANEQIAAFPLIEKHDELNVIDASSFKIGGNF
jgi:hypothetical protein